MDHSFCIPQSLMQALISSKLNSSLLTSINRTKSDALTHCTVQTQLKFQHNTLTKTVTLLVNSRVCNLSITEWATQTKTFWVSDLFYCKRFIHKITESPMSIHQYHLTKTTWVRQTQFTGKTNVISRLKSCLAATQKKPQKPMCFTIKEQHSRQSAY